MPVLVTIDDLGMSRAVNEAATACLSRGSVGCLSILATGDRFGEAAELAAVSGVPLSVHLNCIEPPFLTRGYTPPGSMVSWVTGSRSMRPAVQAEWREQIEKALASGLMITRLDSHRHMHHLPGLDDAVLDLAREYGIGSVRSAILPDRWSRPSGLYLDVLGRRFARKASRAGVGTPAAMLGFSRSGRVTIDYLLRWGDRLPVGSETELVTHPATVPVWSDGQPEELELLLSDGFTRWMEGR